MDFKNIHDHANADAKIQWDPKYTQSKIDHIFKEVEELKKYALEVVTYWCKIWNKKYKYLDLDCIELSSDGFNYSTYDSYGELDGLHFSYEYLTQSDYKAFLDKERQDAIDAENKMKATIKAEKELKVQQAKIQKEQDEKTEYERLKKKYG
jgi:hypothetical protein